MRSGFRLSKRMAVPYTAGCLAIAMGAAARAADKPHLAGRWNFNQEQSDDAHQKVQDAQQNSANARRDSGRPGGGTYPGGGYPGGGYPGGGIGVGVGGIGWPIGGGMGRPGHTGGGQRGGVSSEVWDQLSANPNYLRIDQKEDQVVISDDADHSRALYPDGKRHEEKDANGKKTSTKTEWNGDALVTETKLGRSGKLTETYRVTSDGKQLYVVSEFEDPSLAGPLSIRRVYDLQNTATAK